MNHGSEASDPQRLGRRPLRPRRALRKPLIEGLEERQLLATLQPVDPTSGIAAQIAYCGDSKSAFAQMGDSNSASIHEDNLDNYYIPLNGQYYSDDASVSVQASQTAFSAQVTASVAGGYPQSLTISSGPAAGQTSSAINYKIVPNATESDGEAVDLKLTLNDVASGTSFAYGNWGANDVGNVDFTSSVTVTDDGETTSLSGPVASTDPASTNTGGQKSATVHTHIGDTLQVGFSFTASGTVGNTNYFTSDYLNPSITGNSTLSLSLQAAPQFTWTGAGPDELWSDGDNWAGGTAPGSGVDLVFPKGAQQLTSEDDLGLSFDSISTSDKYEFSASGFLGTNNLTVQQGSLQLDDSATVTGSVTVMPDATLTVGTNAALDGQSAITVEANGTLDDEGKVTVATNDPVSIEGRMIVGTTALLDNEDSITITNDGTLDAFGRLNVGDTAALTVSQGSLLVGLNADLANNGSVTIGFDASLAIEGTFTVATDGQMNLAGLADVGPSGTLDINGSLTEGAGAVLKNWGNLPVSGLLEVGGILTQLCQSAVSQNAGSAPITPTTSASTALEEQATQVLELGDFLADPTETVGEMVARSLPEDVAVVQGAEKIGSWAAEYGYYALRIKYGVDLSVLVSALEANDQQTFATGYNKLARDIFTDIEGAGTSGILTGLTTASALADGGSSLVAAPLAGLLGKLGGSYVAGVYYDTYLAAGVTAQGIARFNTLKALLSTSNSENTRAAGGSGGHLSDQGSVTVQPTGDSAGFRCDHRGGGLNPRRIRRSHGIRRRQPGHIRNRHDRASRSLR